MEGGFTGVTIIMMIIILGTFMGGFLYFITKALKSK